MLEKPRDESPAARARSVLEWLSLRERKASDDERRSQRYSPSCQGSDRSRSRVERPRHVSPMSFAFKEKGRGLRLRDRDPLGRSGDARGGHGERDAGGRASASTRSSRSAAVALLGSAPRGSRPTRARSPIGWNMWDRWPRIAGAPSERSARHRASSARCARALNELGDPNDPSLPARLKSAHSGAKLIELAEQYQQMARVAFDAREFEQCWIGAQISPSSSTPLPRIRIMRLASRSRRPPAGAPSSRPGTPLMSPRVAPEGGRILGIGRARTSRGPLKLAAEMIDAKESLAGRGVSVAMAPRTGAGGGRASRVSAAHDQGRSEVGLWLFLLSHGLPP